jgi:hypothetical protein
VRPIATMTCQQLLAANAADPSCTSRMTQYKTSAVAVEVVHPPPLYICLVFAPNGDVPFVQNGASVLLIHV